MCARGDRCPPPTISELAYYCTKLVHKIIYPSLDIFIIFFFFDLDKVRHKASDMCLLPASLNGLYITIFQHSQRKSTEVNPSQLNSTQVNKWQCHQRPDHHHLSFFSFLLFFLYSQNHFAIIHEVRKRIKYIDISFTSRTNIARGPNKGRTILI